MRRKHHKFIEPRYFMNEKVERIEEVDIGPGDQAIQNIPSEAPPAETTGMEIEPSIEAIEKILNGLYDDGLTNADLITLLEGIIKDINAGFVGEPT